MKKTAVALHDITFSYKELPLFRELNVEFPKGEFISILGPNGSGKTTLIRHLIGALSPGHGTLSFEGRQAGSFSRKEMAKQISYVPQSGRIEWEFTLFECVAMGRYAHRTRLSSLTGHDTDAILESIESLGLSHLKHRLVTELSGGEYQRMLIARALAQESGIIALDEPVSHLDIHHQVEILSLLKNLTRDKGATVITVLHDLNAASAFSDEIILLDRGKLVAQGNVKDVLTKERIEQVYKVSVDIIRDRENNSFQFISPRWS